MSRLAARRARASASVDRAFGERTRIVPMLVGGAVKGGPDPAHLPYEAVGRYGERPATFGGTGVGATVSEKADLRGARHTISYSLAALGANPPPQAGWLVVMLEQDGEPTFRVTPGGPSPAGRLAFDLVPAKAPA